MSSAKTLPLRVALLCWAIMMLALTLYGNWSGLRGRHFFVLACVVGWLLAGEVLLASGGLIEKIVARVNRPVGAALIVVPILTYIVYAVGTGSFSWKRIGLATAFCLVPTIVAASAGEAPFGCWQDYVALFAIFFPYWKGILRNLWVYPDRRVGYVFSCMLAIQVGMIVFFLVRRVDRVGYSYAWARGWTTVAVLSFLFAAVVIIPLSMRIHFVAFDLRHAKPMELVPDIVGIFLFTAWGEEFFFRGLLQNALQRTLRNEYLGWALASVIFGLSHILHGNYPNWKYVFLATFAGMIYGFAWRRTGSMTVSSTIHMAVDVMWHQLFRTL
jgi:hypothetical protein